MVYTCARKAQANEMEGDMGAGGAPKQDRQVVAAEMPVVPAVARDAEKLDSEAQIAQTDARSRLRGIRSTYTRFASAGNGGANGTKAKLG